MLDIDTFIALVEEEGVLLDFGSAAYKDKNEVARAWKKVNQVLKMCDKLAKCEPF